MFERCKLEVGTNTLLPALEYDHTFSCRPLNSVSSNFNALSTDSLLENSMYANLRNDHKKITISNNSHHLKVKKSLIWDHVPFRMSGDLIANYGNPIEGAAWCKMSTQLFRCSFVIDLADISASLG